MGDIMYRNGIQKEDFLCVLKDVGIRENDTVFVHSDIMAFGRIETAETMDKLIEVLKLSVKNGTLLMPTYTYSFTKNEVYNNKLSPSVVGSLTNCFRVLPDVSRINDPIFSTAVFGLDTNFYMNSDVHNCFGSNSVYSRLLEKEAKILMLGSEFSRSLTFLHFVEQKFGVYYRKLKEFKGIKNIDGREYEDCCEFFVREPRDIIVNLEKLEKRVVNNGLLKKEKLGFGNIMLINVEELYDECIQMLSEDENCFLEV